MGSGRALENGLELGYWRKSAEERGKKEQPRGASCLLSKCRLKKINCNFDLLKLGEATEKPLR